MKKKISSKVKKKVEEFMIAEEGKVSKSTILKAGVIVAAASIMASNTANAGVVHSNALTKTGTCVNHSNHSNHISHSSY